MSVEVLSEAKSYVQLERRTSYLLKLLVTQGFPSAINTRWQELNNIVRATEQFRKQQDVDVSPVGVKPR